MSPVSCRAPDLCGGTGRAIAINKGAQIAEGIRCHELSQRGVKDVKVDQLLRTGSLRRFIPRQTRWKICAGFGEFTAKAHKRERI